MITHGIIRNCSTWFLDIRVYQLVCSELQKLSWYFVVEIGSIFVKVYPSKACIILKQTATIHFATSNQLYANTIHNSPVAVPSTSNTDTLKLNSVLPMTSSSGRCALTSFLSVSTYSCLRKRNVIASGNKMHIWN